MEYEVVSKAGNQRVDKSIVVQQLDTYTWEAIYTNKEHGVSCKAKGEGQDIAVTNLLQRLQILILEITRVNKGI